MVLKEKKHRLPRESYLGHVSVAFTLCLKRDVAAGFSLRDPEIVREFTDILQSVVSKEDCFAPVYCFMDDHQHLILTGKRSDSDVWNSIVKYKQKTGFWMSRNRPEMKWQKDFYDHVIRTNKDVAAQVRYVLDNPVRKGVVASWEEYPFKGAIGCKLEDVLAGII